SCGRASSPRPSPSSSSRSPPPAGARISCRSGRPSSPGRTSPSSSRNPTAAARPPPAPPPPPHRAAAAAEAADPAAPPNPAPESVYKRFLLRRSWRSRSGAGDWGGGAGRGGFGRGGGCGQLLRHHADRPARGAVADEVQTLHRAQVLRLVVRVEEDHRRPLGGFLRLGRAIPDLEAIDRVV